MSLSDYSPTEQLVLIPYACLVFVTLLRHFLFSQVMRDVPILGSASPRLPADQLPHVTILVPAKDEERSIRTCLDSLRAQNYPNIDVLVVNDRSVDQTAAIVQEITAEDSRIQLLTIEDLPPGWTGKTHALHRGQQRAKGDWLLFVDADTRLAPDGLAICVSDALAHQADLVSLLPKLLCESFWEGTVQPFASVCLMILYPLPKVNDPEAKTMGFANGQFILIRRAAYDQIGGHEAVRDQFVEDIHLGRRVRQAGLGLRVALAPEIFSVRMYASLAEIRRGWSRILYSAVDGKPFWLVCLLLAMILFSVSSYVVLAGASLALLSGVSTPFVWTMFVLGVLHEFLQTTIMARIYRLSHSPLRYLASRPLAVAVMIEVVLRTIRLCWTHQVTWRGTTYGKELRAR